MLSTPLREPLFIFSTNSALSLSLKLDSLTSSKASLFFLTNFMLTPLLLFA